MPKEISKYLALTKPSSLPWLLFHEQMAHQQALDVLLQAHNSPALASGEYFQPVVNLKRKSKHHLSDRAIEDKENKE